MGGRPGESTTEALKSLKAFQPPQEQFGLLDLGKCRQPSPLRFLSRLLGQGAGDLPQTPLAKVNPFEGDALAGFIAYTEAQVSDTNTLWVVFQST